MTAWLVFTHLASNVKGRDKYVSAMLRQCKDTAGTVAEWKAGQARISASCSAISETLLLTTEGKRVYTESAFVQAQAEHTAQVREFLFICMWIKRCRGCVFSLKCRQKMLLFGPKQSTWPR